MVEVVCPNGFHMKTIKPWTNNATFGCNIYCRPDVVWTSMLHCETFVKQYCKKFEDGQNCGTVQHED